MQIAASHLLLHILEVFTYISLLSFPMPYYVWGKSRLKLREVAVVRRTFTASAPGALFLEVIKKTEGVASWQFSLKIPPNPS